MSKAHTILSRARLPIPPLRHVLMFILSHFILVVNLGWICYYVIKDASNINRKSKRGNWKDDNSR